MNQLVFNDPAARQEDVAWLDRAVEEQLAEVRARPRKRYLINRSDPDKLSLG